MSKSWWDQMDGRIEMEPIVHVRLRGESHDISFDDLDIGDLSTDEEIFKALANHFDVPEWFVGYVIERHTNGNITVRPEAVFGEMKIPIYWNKSGIITIQSIDTKTNAQNSVIGYIQGTQIILNSEWFLLHRSFILDEELVTLLQNENSNC